MKPPPFGRGQRIGLFGGSFNPAHYGHYMVALYAMKRLQLDLKAPEGKAIFMKLVESADIVVEFFNPTIKNGAGVWQPIRASS